MVALTWAGSVRSRPGRCVVRTRPGRLVTSTQRLPETKAIKNRVHLDLTTGADDRDAEIERLLRLGARRVNIGQTGDESWTVLADPEGNEFCVVRPKTTLIDNLPPGGRQCAVQQSSSSARWPGIRRYADTDRRHRARAR